MARAGAQLIAERARNAVAVHGAFTFAVSGGHTPWAMFSHLVSLDVPWSSVTIYQVDERIAPEGDPDRNLTHLRQSLGDVPARVEAMPVEDRDPEAGAARYGALLPGATGSRRTSDSVPTGTPPHSSPTTRCST